MKTSDLTDELLDYWVAKSEGFMRPCIKGGVCYVDLPHDHRFSPSAVPEHGQPIMERLCIGVDRPSKGQAPPVWRALGDMPDEVHKRLYKARAPYTHNNVLSAYGPTMLIAGMRVRVAMAYGETVPDESEKAT